MIIEKQNTINLQRPAVVIDTLFEPKPKAPLPNKNGFALAIVGSPRISAAHAPRGSPGEECF